jgi:hypothetical protein
MIFLGEFIWIAQPVYAQEPKRETTLTLPYTEYQWWLNYFLDNSVLCEVVIEHEGYPTGAEVLHACGETYYTIWNETPPCKALAKGGDLASCEGGYLYLLAETPKEKQVIVDLPEATAWISLEGCDPQPPENRCAKLPALLITAEEPLPNEQITAVRGVYNDQPFRCDSATCTLPLSTTPVEGVPVEFWAVSSYGDSSEHYTAQVRVIDTGVSHSPGSGGWFVDVMSSQWRGAPIASCAKIWQAFPPVGGQLSWLSTPDQPELLASDQPFYYLAGRLIAQGIIDASTCPANGLLPNGYADACGMEQARPQLLVWQNQFDARIIESADQTGIPAQLLKNLFAQESQFWPGVFRVPYEFGLGQITDNGAEAVLLWNDTFYEQFCPLVLGQDSCEDGYLQLNSTDQAILRGALAVQAKADCADCPMGIDLSNVDVNMSLFASTLQANCQQVAQIIDNATQKIPGAVSSYEDLWRYTIANYHAGPGCVSYAIFSTWTGEGRLDWEQVSSHFTDACKGAIAYVENVAR